MDFNTFLSCFHLQNFHFFSSPKVIRKCFFKTDLGPPTASFLIYIPAKWDLHNKYKVNQTITGLQWLSSGSLDKDNSSITHTKEVMYQPYSQPRLYVCYEEYRIIPPPPPACLQSWVCTHNPKCTHGLVLEHFGDLV